MMVAHPIWRQIGHAVVIGSAALLMVIVLITTAAAHTTTLVASIPAAGSTVAGDLAQVIAQFGEELDTHQSSLKVVDVGGQQVSVGNGQVDLDDPDHKAMLAQLPSPLADGVYIVRWHLMLTSLLSGSLSIVGLPLVWHDPLRHLLLLLALRCSLFDASVGYIFAGQGERVLSAGRLIVFRSRLGRLVDSLSSLGHNCSLGA